MDTQSRGGKKELSENGTDSGIEGIDGNSTSANEDLIGLEIGHLNIISELQHLRPAESGQ